MAEMNEKQRAFAEEEVAPHRTKLAKLWGEDYAKDPRYELLLREIAGGRPVNFVVSDRVYVEE